MSATTDTDIVAQPTRWPTRWDPAIIATEMRERIARGRIVWYRGGYWCYTGTHYREIAAPEIDGHSVNLIRQGGRRLWIKGDNEIAPIVPSQSQLAAVRACLMEDVLPDSATAPTWIKPGPEASDEAIVAWAHMRAEAPDARECLPLANGILHLPTRKLIPHNNALFSTFCLPFPYDENACEPVEWLKFLDSQWPSCGGEEHPNVKALRQWFGYVLQPESRYHKILVLLGPTRSGKGVTCRTLQTLVGRDNYAAPTMASLGERFGLEGLLGKRLAVVSDARLAGPKKAEIAERLLSISGDDRLSCDRKNRLAVPMDIAPKMMLASNEEPAFTDSSCALPKRMILLRMEHSFIDKEDADLERRLQAEMSAILLWALSGEQEVRAEGRLYEPESSRMIRRDMEEYASPVKTWLEQCCIIDPKASEAVDAMHDSYRGWAQQEGIDHLPSMPWFTREVRTIMPGIEQSRQRRDGVRVRTYMGIRMSEEGSKYKFAWDDKHANR